MHKAGNYIAAEAKFEQACQKCIKGYEPKYMYLRNKGESLTAQKKYLEAIEAFESSPDFRTTTPKSQKSRCER